MTQHFTLAYTYQFPHDICIHINIHVSTFKILTAVGTNYIWHTCFKIYLNCNNITIWLCVWSNKCSLLNGIVNTSLTVWSLKRSLSLHSCRPVPPTSCSTSAKTRSASPPSLHPSPPLASPRTTSRPRPTMAWMEPLPVSAWRRTDFCHVFYTFHFILSCSYHFSYTVDHLNQQKLEPPPLIWLRQEVRGRGTSLRLVHEHHGVGM